MSYDWQARRKEKEASRKRDAEDLASGRKTVEQLRQENGAFAFPRDRIHIDWAAARARENEAREARRAEIAAQDAVRAAQKNKRREARQMALAAGTARRTKP